MTSLQTSAVETVPDDSPSVSVVVVTLNRSDCVRICLEHLQNQTRAPLDICVVDASRDDLTEKVVAAFPRVEYFRNPLGYGHMTAGRNQGILQTQGQVIAFLDDDAYAHPDWLENLIKPYTDPKVGAVGGRALRGTPNEATRGADDIGTFKSYGFLGGNFGADSPVDLAVFHLPGCNMSFRRDVLAQLGGLRDDYVGTEVREETDICVRVGKLGLKVIWTPFAVVDHVAAPQAKGKRMDLRYHFYSRRNHYPFLIRNFGPGASVLRRYFVRTLSQSARRFRERPHVALFYLAVEIAGCLSGIWHGWLLWRRERGEFRRLDACGLEISRFLRENMLEIEKTR